MAKFIETLLSNEKNPEKKLEKINEAALALYDSAIKAARNKKGAHPRAEDINEEQKLIEPEDIKDKQKLFVFGADAISEELQLIVDKVLASENLAANGQRFQQIMTGLNQWDVTEKWRDYEDEDEEARDQFRLDIVKSTFESLLAKEQVKILKAECHKYLEHLEETQKRELTKPALDQDKGYLACTQDKIKAIEEMLLTLDAKLPFEDRVDQFREKVQKNRATLEKRRDRTEESIFKAIITFLFIKPAHALGLWKTTGQESVGKMDEILKPPTREYKR